MNGLQLFYLTIMVGLFVVYLVVCKICETKQELAKYKTIASRPLTRIDCNNAEELQKVISEINNAINEEEQKNG